jgi:serine/threonine protein kinase
MSEIFLAKTVGIGGFQKPLVIKKLLPLLSTRPRYVRRFVNEAKTLARLNHSNIVQIYDMGLIQGEYYIAMEFIEGRNVAHVLSKAKKTGSPPPPELAMHVALEVANGLAYAHRRTGVTGESLGLVHQDVNSFNVMVAYSGHIKLIDFGIARVLLDKERPDDKLPVAGKLLYFAPEQLQGKKFDHRVDIYGVGTLLFEMLTGNRLFEHGQNVNETMRSILETDIAAKIEDDQRIRPELKPFLIKATAVNPDDRFGWMEEMIEDMRRAVKKCFWELVPEEFSKYLTGQFEKEMLIDRRRMRKLLTFPARSSKKASSVDDNDQGDKGREKTSVLEMLAGLTPGDIDLLETLPKGLQPSVIRTLEVREGRTIFQQGDPGQYIYVIQRGKVGVFLDIGQSEHITAILGPGDFFGETAMTGEHRRCLSARALEQCSLLCLESDAFAELCQGETGKEVVERLLERQKEIVSVLAGALLPDPLSRFIHALIQLYSRSESEEGVAVEIGEVKDLTRFTDDDQIVKYIRKLKSLNIVEADEKTLTVKDLGKLENILKMLSGEAKFSLKL